MNKLRNILYSTLLFFSFGVANGQQIPMYSQYIMNGYLVNPSFAGIDGFTSVNLTVREQWMGMKGSPGTYEASFQTVLQNNKIYSKSNFIRRKVSRPTKARKVGVGASLFSDHNGIVSRTGLQALYAYHIPMGRSVGGTKNDLSMGLALLTYQHAINVNKLEYTYDDDPYYSAYNKSVFITDFNFGASYSTPKYYLGFSMTNMLRGNLVIGNSSDSKIGELGHYFLTGGVNIPIDRYWSLKPSAFIKTSDMVLKSMQLDLTTRVFYKEDYWAGLSYRTNDAIIAMFGLKYNQFYFAYAFDFTLTDIRNQSIGSMELSVAVKFGEPNKRSKWLIAF